jgi:hypothetical protein
VGVGSCGKYRTLQCRYLAPALKKGIPGFSKLGISSDDLGVNIKEFGAIHPLMSILFKGKCTPPAMPCTNAKQTFLSENIKKP